MFKPLSNIYGMDGENPNLILLFSAVERTLPGQDRDNKTWIQHSYKRTEGYKRFRLSNVVSVNWV